MKRISLLTLLIWVVILSSFLAKAHYLGFSSGGI